MNTDVFGSCNKSWMCLCAGKEPLGGGYSVSFEKFSVACRHLFILVLVVATRRRYNEA